MSLGESAPRPVAVSAAAVARNWARTFGPRVKKAKRRVKQLRDSKSTRS